MRRRTAALASAALVSAALVYFPDAHAQVRPPAAAPAPAAPAARPVGDQSDVPVKEVVLFSSGVGYFEHFGSIKGDAASELRFKTDQINDVLKSLLLQDMDGGTIGTVSYPGQAPIEHTLKSFQVDITANPTMGDLLNQLRGAKITVGLGGPNKVVGTILGVEKKQKAAGEKGDAVTVSVLNLKAERKFISVPLDDVRDMELDDARLQSELDEALAALAQSRDQDKKPVTIHFRGQGDRRVRIGYVVETPVWKTSYRLILGSGDDAQKPGPADEPKKDVKPGAADAKPADHAAKLQGWAIVENQTDNDWKDVQLSLVSGRPLSFIQDLYHALYVPRPVVQPDLYASLRPQTYGGGVTNEEMERLSKAMKDAPDFALNSTANNAYQNSKGGGGIGAGGEQTNNLFANAKGGEEKPKPIDPTSSIISAASAAKVGELFQYTVGSVSLGRQKSAMIPIVTDNIDAEKLSIYNQSVLADHPLTGARLKNNTKKYLLQGPITVLDRGSYAGDARIEDLPPGQERLISYGIDQQMLVDPGTALLNSQIVTGSIVKGVLRLTTKDAVEQTYVVDNKSDDEKTLIVEHRREADWKLTSPKSAEETTVDLYRFRRVLPAHKPAKLVVQSERVYQQEIALLQQDVNGLSIHLNSGTIPKSVRDALAKAVAMKTELEDNRVKSAKRLQHIAEVTAEQSRIRENMKTVAASTDYYQRLVKKLDEQETGIELMQKEIADLQKAHETLQQQFDDYLTGLSVE
ncbi:MAG: hypothetical protein JWL69_3265 [Phycisphaerales bacterium]|nr:hypothetical protein [Phycisphaerales bacterium]